MSLLCVPLLICCLDVPTPHKVLTGHDDSVRTVEFANRTTLVSGSESGDVVIWKRERRWEVVARWSHGSSVVGLRCVRKKNLVASVGGTCVVWDLNAEKQLHRFDCSGMVAKAVAASPDGLVLAIGGRVINRGCGGVLLFDTATGQLKRELMVNRELDIVDLCYSANGKRLAGGTYSTGPADAIAVVWDPATGKETRRVSNLGDMSRVALNRDGSIVVAGAGFKKSRGHVYVFDVDDGRRRATLDGHSGGAWQIKYSPDGGTVAVASAKVSLWDATNWSRSGQFDAGQHCYSVAFSPEGNYLGIGVSDGTVRVVEVPKRHAVKSK